MSNKTIGVPKNQRWIAYKKFKACGHIAGFIMRDGNDTHRDSIKWRLENYPIGSISTDTGTDICLCDEESLYERVGYNGYSTIDNSLIFEHGITEATIWED